MNDFNKIKYENLDAYNLLLKLDRPKANTSEGLNFHLNIVKYVLDDKCIKYYTFIRKYIAHSGHNIMIEDVGYAMSVRRMSYNSNVILTNLKIREYIIMDYTVTYEEIEYFLELFYKYHREMDNIRSLLMS